MGWRRLSQILRDSFVLNEAHGSEAGCGHGGERGVLPLTCCLTSVRILVSSNSQCARHHAKPFPRQCYPTFKTVL